MTGRGIIQIVFIGLLVAGCSGGAGPKPPTTSTTTKPTKPTPTTTTTTTPPPPAKLDGQQGYSSPQKLADELTGLGHRCDMTDDGPSTYFDRAGRCYLGGSAGPETILVTYSSQAQIDTYFTKMAGHEYAWLLGKNWGINCKDGEPTLCKELQAQLGGTIKRPGDAPPTTTTSTKMPPPMSANDQEVAATAKRWLLGNFGQRKDGSFKDIPCTDEDPSTYRFCWVQNINDIAYSNGVLYLLMGTYWTSEDGAPRNVSAQNHVARSLENGPGPRLVMDNVKTVQSVDPNGIVRSDAPLQK